MHSLDELREVLNIAALLAVDTLDRIDGDPDDEDNADDEPGGDDLGDQSWPEGGIGFLALLRGGAHDEDAEDCDPREDDGEDAEHDGREPDDAV